MGSCEDRKIFTIFGIVNSGIEECDNVMLHNCKSRPVLQSSILYAETRVGNLWTSKPHIYKQNFGRDNNARDNYLLCW